MTDGRHAVAGSSEVTSDEPRGRRGRLPFLLAALVFVGATWYAVRSADVAPGEVRWVVVALLVLVAVPVSVVLNGEEFRAAARLIGQRHSFREGLRVSVLGSAANIMPVPGAVLVRAAVMVRAGAGYGPASTALFITGVSWGGATGVFAGALLTVTGRQPVGVLGLAAGLAAWGVAWAFLGWRLPTAPRRAWGRVLVVELVTVAVGAVRFLLVIVAVGQSIDLSQAAALTVAGAVAAATGIFPGGLGLREALAALIGPVVALPAQTALLSAVGNRIAEYLVLAPWALVLSRAAPAGDATQD